MDAFYDVVEAIYIFVPLVTIIFLGVTVWFYARETGGEGDDGAPTHLESGPNFSAQNRYAPSHEEKDPVDKKDD